MVKLLCPKCVVAHPKNIPFEFNQIEEYIYIGSNQCCERTFKKILIKKGVKADISLEDTRVDSPFGVDYFLWLPNKDKNPPRLDKLTLGIEALDFFVKNKIKVYVHCRRGHGRAPTLVIAYYISKGLSPEKAFKKVEKKRPDIHLSNKQWNFLKQLKTSNNSEEKV